MNLLQTVPDEIEDNENEGKKTLEEFERDFYEKYKEKDNGGFNLVKLLKDPETSFADIAHHYGVSRQWACEWGKRYGITGKSKRKERDSKPIYLVSPVIQQFIKRAKNHRLNAEPFAEKVEPPKIVTVKTVFINEKICFPRNLTEPRDYVDRKRREHRELHGGVSPKLYWRVVPPSNDEFDFLCMMDEKRARVTYIIPREVLQDKIAIYISVNRDRKLKPAIDWSIYREAWMLLA